jgi:pentatricopeptide repeat protein
MRASQSICALCRHRLVAKAAVQVSHQRALSSWPGNPASAGDASVAGLPLTHDHPNQPDNGGPRSVDPRIEHGAAKERRQRSHAPSRTRRPDANAATANRDMADLFRQIVERSSAEAPAVDGANERSMNIKLVQDIGKLQDMLDAEVPTRDAFNFLQTDLYPAVKQKGITVPKVFHTVVSSLMHEVLHVKKNDVLNSDLPSAAEILRIYAGLGYLKPAEWLSLTGELVKYLCEMKTSADDYPSIEAFEDHLATKNKVILDLVEAWKVLSLPNFRVAKSSPDSSEILDGFWFPRLDKFSISKHARSNSFSLALSSLFPQYNPNQLGDKLAVLAIATLTLLIDGSRSNTSSRRSASRFITKVAHLMGLTGVNEKTLRSAITVTYPSIEGYIMGQWPKIEAHIAESNQSSGLSSDWQGSGPHTRPARGSQDKAYFEKKLSQAYFTRNLGEVDRLWHEFSSMPADNKTLKAAKLRQTPHLFDSFINTYMALNKPDKAIEVWNTLPLVGLKPTLKTWNFMLDGCKKAQNLKGLNTVWQRLISSGAKLDMPIWTTRIAGLMDCNDPSAAIAALEEMAVTWRQAERTKSGHAVRPTIEPVNAALTGLIRLNNHTAAQRLLAWAKEHGINPDIYTFNLLLRPLVLDGRDKEVQAIFKHMETLGVPADAATFTVIIEGTLTKLNASDSQKQVEIVASIFDDMKAAGIEANHQTYGKMIHLLLRSGDRAQESVKAVLEHLWKQGLELSPHIYTALVEHYFSRNPPDLETVNELIQRRRLLDYDDMDRIFYDRVIKGYASAGDPETAFGIYCKLSSAGFLVNLDAQYELLHALLLIDRRDDAQRIVEDTVRRYSEQHGEQSWLGHRFWHTAERNGFIDWIPDVRGGRAVMRAPA